ncbi:MAG: hypothetical protein AB7R55_12215 [Gemmatimonadales bacterium]
MAGLSPIHLLLIAVAALVAGGALGWLLASRRSAAKLQSEVDQWEGRFLTSMADGESLSRKASRLADELKTTRSKLGTAEVGQEAARAALEGRTEELGRVREALRKAQATVAGRELELDELAARSADAGPLREALAEREASVERSESRARALAARVQELTGARSKLESEGMRLAVRVESLERELQQATETGRRELEGHRRALGAANALVEQSRREHERLADRLATVTKALESANRELDRFRAKADETEAEVRSRSAERIARELELSQTVAEREAAIGSLEAKAERLDPLVRRLEDREALLRAVLFERDEAVRCLAELERRLAAEAEALEGESARRQRAESKVVALESLAAQADRRAAAAIRERDAARAASSRAELEIATVRNELRERDRRFRLLAEENARQLGEMENRVVELETEMLASSAILADGDFMGTNGASLIRVGNAEAGTSEAGRLSDEPAEPAAAATTERPSEGPVLPPPAGEPAEEPPSAGAPIAAPDDLTLIKGIGPVLAARLRERGVTRIEQIAAWTGDDIEEIGRALGAFPDRIRRDRWVEGARELLEERAGSA